MKDGTIYDAKTGKLFNYHGHAWSVDFTEFCEYELMVLRCPDVGT